MEKCGTLENKTWKKMNSKELRQTLKTVNDAYRQGNPVMTDAEYDVLEAQLREISPDDEWFDKGVNDEKPKDREMKLPYKMMSLDKIKNFDELIAWMKKFPEATFVITPKYDGLSVGMSGNSAWTRGDGTTGQDCSEHVNAIYIKPEIHSEMVIRGEIIIDNGDWNMFKEINVGAKSQRNSATGLINGDFDKSRSSEYALLRIMPYEIQGSDLNKVQQLDALMATNYEKVANPNFLTKERLVALYMGWKKLYPIDGLVIDVNEDKYRHEVEANGNPSYAVAYKDPSFSEIGYGVIDRIERSVNRNGVVTPVIILKEPLNLAGADIQRANGINMKYVEDWLLYPGETVAVIRSGEVIPKIIGVGDVKIPFRESYSSMQEYNDAYEAAKELRRSALTLMMVDTSEVMELDRCPECGAALHELYNPDGTWCEKACGNEGCQGRRKAALVKFFEIAGIDGFGPKTFEQLFNEGLANSFYDVFLLGYGDLERLDGWGDKMITSFLSETERLTKGALPFARFLHAAGWFADLGEKTIQKIIDEDGWKMDEEELVNIEGVQEITAEKFVDGRDCWVKNCINYSRMFSFAYMKTPVIEGKLNGVVVCATGFRDQEMFQEIKNLGGVVADSLTKAVNVLIVKDLSSRSSKVQKAEKNGVEILDIAGFREKYLS